MYKDIDVIMEEWACFVKDRITSLRMEKGISEYALSYTLGHSRSYINNITSGKALPSLAGLFDICECFDVTPVQFFDEKNRYPQTVNRLADRLKALDEEDLRLVSELVDRLIGKTI